MVRKEMFRGMALGLAFTIAATSVSPMNSVYASDDQTTVVEKTSDENEKLTAESLNKMGNENALTVESSELADKNVEVATASNATQVVLNTVSSGDAVTVEESVEEKVTVTFKTNINILNKEVLGDVEITKGETVTPPELLAVGRKVCGWYTTISCDAGTEFDFSQPVTENIILYPKFESAVAELTLMVNGKVNSTRSIDVNGTIILSNLGIPKVKPGYRFAGWTYDEEGTDLVQFGTDRFGENTTLYAKFVPYIYMNINSESDYLTFLGTIISAGGSNTNYDPSYSFEYSEGRFNKPGLLPKGDGSVMDYDYIVNNYSGDELEEVLEAYHELAYVYLWTSCNQKCTFEVYDKEYSKDDFVYSLVDPYWEDEDLYYDAVNQATKNKASKFDLSKIEVNTDINKIDLSNEELKILNTYGAWKNPNKQVKEILGASVSLDIYDNDGNKLDVTTEGNNCGVQCAVTLNKEKFIEEDADRIIYNIFSRNVNGELYLDEYNYGGENHYVDFHDSEIFEGCCSACAANHIYNMSKVNGDFAETDEGYKIRIATFKTDTYTVIYDNTYYEIIYMIDGEEYDRQEVMYETTPAEPAEPVKEGFVFKEWKEVNQTTKEDEILGTVKVVTMEAVFEEEKQSYKVKFIVDGEEFDCQNIEENSLAENSVEAPAKEGYKFLYWSYNGVEFDFNTEITSDIELEAVYKIAEYKVALNYGDKLNKNDNLTIKYNDKITKPVVETIIKDGIEWELTGWYVNDKVYDFDEPVKADMEIVAKWEAKEYLVAFDSDGGTEIEKQWSENKKVKKPENPVKEGYAFKYWEHDGVEFKFTSEITEPITLKAVYEINKFNITFDSDGGSEVEKQVIEYNKTVEKPEAPVKEGYTFKYWVIDETEEAFDFDTKVKSDFKLKAVYEINNYTVKFDTKGGTEVEDQKIQYNGKVVYPKNPEKEGYRFRYWTWNDKQYNFGTNIKSDIELVAYYEIKEYTVTILPYIGNTGKIQSQIEYLGKAGKPADPEMEGYKFLYWSCNDSEYDFNSPIKQNITIKAVYEKIVPKKYTVTFDSNGGSTINKQNIVEGKMVPKPNNPRKQNYKFLYWTSNGQEYTFNQPVNNDMTLVAVWESLEPITRPEDKVEIETTYDCTVGFDSKGGTKVSSQTIKSGSKVSKPKEPVKEGYNFIGWYLGGSEFDFSKPIISNIYLVAQWEKIEEPVENPTEENNKTPDIEEPEKDITTEDENSPTEDTPVEDNPEVIEDTESSETVDDKTEETTDDEKDASTEKNDNKVVIENDADEVEMTAAEKFIEGLRKVLIGFSICLLGLLGILGILFLIWLLSRRVKIYNNTDSSDYEDKDFELVLKTFVKNEENQLFKTFFVESFKRDVVRTFIVNIPDYITDNEMTNEYTIVLTKRFVKKHNGETLIIKFEGLNKEVVFTITEGNTEIGFYS